MFCLKNAATDLSLNKFSTNIAANTRDILHFYTIFKNALSPIKLLSIINAYII